MLGEAHAMSDFAAIHSQTAWSAYAAATPLRFHTRILRSMPGRTIALAKSAGHAEGVDLIVFPELVISSYAIDDLPHQDALLAAVEAALGDLSRRAAAYRRCCSLVPRSGGGGGSITARSPFRVAGAGRGAQAVPAQLPRIL
jgi:hypothetical protein